MEKKKSGKTRKIQQTSDNGHASLIALIVVIFIVGLSLGIAFSQKNAVPVIESGIETGAMKETGQINVSYEGFIPAEVHMDGNILTLSSGCDALRFGITQDQAFSISQGMQGIIEARPLTHDSMKDILENFDVEVISVKIDGVQQGGIYTAKLLMRQNSRLLDLDVRPSDATAMAVRLGKTIYVHENIMNDFGIDICEEQA